MLFQDLDNSHSGENFANSPQSSEKKFAATTASLHEDVVIVHNTGEPQKIIEKEAKEEHNLGQNGQNTTKQVWMIFVLPFYDHISVHGCDYFRVAFLLASPLGLGKSRKSRARIKLSARLNLARF